MCDTVFRDIVFSGTKATFEDFLAEHRTCSNYASNVDAQDIFNFLSEDENLVAMLFSAASGKSALSGCVKGLEDYYDNMVNPIFKLSEKYPRTVVGRMVATILKPFGYESTTQIKFPQASECKYFSSALGYEKTR